jgi:resuscitation-promoting factor RpfB
MARVLKGRLAKVIAQVAALALVVGGLVAFAVTQRGGETTASAEAATPVSASAEEGDPGADFGASVLQLERASQVNLELPKVVTVTSGPYKRSFATGEGTVEAALLAGDVQFDDNDKVTPARNTKITRDVNVTVQSVDTKTATTTASVPFKTIKVKDEDLARGKSKLQAAGKAGEKVTTWSVTTVDGKETARKAVSTETVTAPVDRRVAVGTKAPAPKPQPKPVQKAQEPAKKASSSPSTSSSSSSRSSSAASAPSTRTPEAAPQKASQASAPASGAWQALAQCESGGNWSINTGNGYYGGLQFSASSWAGAGGTQYAPLPHQATPAQQIATAEVLRANGGWGHWPHCSAQLGLR